MEPRLKIGFQIALYERAIFRKRTYPGTANDTAVSCAQMAETIEMPIGCGLVCT